MLKETITELGLKHLFALAAGAPKEPAEMEIREWERQFFADYPKPWTPSRNAELEAASRAATCAVAKATRFTGPYKQLLLMPRSRPGWEQVSAWFRWRKECERSFREVEWPFVWAKRQLDACAKVFGE